MDKRANIALFALTVCIVIGLFIFRTHFDVLAPEAAQKPKTKSIDPALQPFLQKAEEIKELAKRNPRKASEEADEFIKVLPGKYRRYFDFGFNAGVGPVNFFGKIVDQFGVPVAGASITYEIGGRFLASGGGIGKTTTDENGVFEIHGRGANIDLGSVQHPEIGAFYFPYLKKTTEGHMEPRGLGITFYDVPPTVGAVVPLLSDGTREHPYELKAWRVDKWDPVKMGFVGGFVSPDGAVHTYDFNERDLRYRAKKGEVDGYLRVSCSRGLKGDDADVDWRVEITPVAGGIQPTDDLYPFVAPESGYQPSFVVSRKAGSPDYQRMLLNQRFYFTAENGQVYGTIFVNFEPLIREDYCRVEVAQFVVNENGSRNLAYKVQ